MPYDSVWNPGADGATRIELSEEVRVEGEPLAAGSYSIGAIPRPDRWTRIFSRAHHVFHVPYPGEEHDALRLDLRPVPAPHTETMAFTFPVALRDSAELHFRWGDIRIPIRIRPDQ